MMASIRADFFGFRAFVTRIHAYIRIGSPIQHPIPALKRLLPGAMTATSNVPTNTASKRITPKSASVCFAFFMMF